MFSKEFLEFLNYECAVGIATCAQGEAHISNTWNRYLVIKGDRILIPAAGMKKTQSNAEGKKGSGLIGSLTKKGTILHQNQDLKPKKKLKLKV